MQYPRIKKFSFDIDGTFTIPGYLVGRLDRVAYELYGATRMYKPLASANNIVLTQGFRIGIRRTTDAIREELIDDGFTGNELEQEYERIMDEKRIHDYDWNSYSDHMYGMASDVYEGRVLVVPTFASCEKWLRQYEYLEV